MSIEENKSVVRRYREIHNRGKLDELDAIVAADLVSHSLLPGLPPGLAGGKIAHQGFAMSFPDIQTTTEALVAEGDIVVERYSAHGTHTGTPFMGAPASGKAFKIETVVTYRLVNGKIVEMWGLNDGVSLMMQLGMMPTPSVAP
ncbi:MAG: ester cyclase [Anaerolineae bacterium]